MSVLVVDGVRRRLDNDGAIGLRPITAAVAAAAVLPTPWAANGWTLDGLRRPEPKAATATLANNLADNLEIPESRAFSPWGMASLATIPMLAAAALIGGRTIIADHHALVQHPRPAAAQAQPVSAADQQTAAAPSSTSLQQVIDGFGMADTYSLYVKDLKTGRLAIANPDRVFESASLYKLFIAEGIYQRIDAGQLNYGDQAGGDTGNTIAGCLNLMITISDNDCGHALGGILGWNNITQQLRAQGYDTTDLSGTYTTTTPRNVALLYERLYKGSLLSADSTNQFVNLLKSQKVNNRLPQGLPAGTSIAHKTGDLDGYLHDAGIVFGPKTDYLVVMMGAPGANPNDFATLSQKLYSFFNQ